jgi:hypothetical protein
MKTISEDKPRTFDTSYPATFPLQQARELLHSPYFTEEDKDTLTEWINKMLKGDDSDNITFDENMHIQTRYRWMLEGKLTVK